MSRSLKFLAALVFGMASAAESQVRTFVSTNGVDNGTCTKANPCRTFGAAIAAVANRGEVVALDTGGYGPFVIDKSVTVVAPAGIHAAIAPTSGSAITVNTPGIIAVLIGLYLNGQGATQGIFARGFSSFHVSGCTIDGFGIGLQVDAASENREVFLTNTTVRNSSGFSSSNGFTFIDFSGGDDTPTSLVLAGCRSENNAQAGFVFSSPHLKATIVDSFAVGNAGPGFLIYSNTHVNLDRCVSANNGTNGIEVENLSPGTVRVSNSTVTGNNGAGFFNSAVGTFESLQNNFVRENGSPSSGTITLGSPN